MTKKEKAQMQREKNEIGNFFLNNGEATEGKPQKRDGYPKYHNLSHTARWMLDNQEKYEQEENYLILLRNTIINTIK